ncbi:MAG: ArsC/Spx/MgsR family protein [Patescibacteria group bacterium]
MEKIILYEKPTCTKCRIAVKTLKEKGLNFEDVNYYEKPFTEKGLADIFKKMNARPRDILRTIEPIYRELGIAKKDYSNEELIKLMVLHPDLIQRPIIVKGNKAVLARPIEKLEKLLE